jgi:hypothetical protein
MRHKIIDKSQYKKRDYKVKSFLRCIQKQKPPNTPPIKDGMKSFLILGKASLR